MKLKSASYSEFIPGSYVSNKNNLEWGVGQIQSCINNIITINFENVGKKVMNTNIMNLEIIKI
jgi:hypothetical protein